jgi:hypothetical protein
MLTVVKDITLSPYAAPPVASSNWKGYTEVTLTLVDTILEGFSSMSSQQEVRFANS